jgi:Fic family protein
MDEPITPESAVRLLKALDEGKLDYLFQTAHIDYSERDGLAGSSLSLGLPRDAVMHLVSAIRRAQGLTILAGAWGDYSAWVTISASMVELLHEIDVHAKFDFYSNSDLPDDEVRALQNRILVEEVLPLGLTLEELSRDNDVATAQARNAARRMLEEGSEPASEYERWVLQFFNLMRRLPELAEEPLTVHRLQELHAMLALDKSQGGVFRTDDTADSWGVGLLSERNPGAPAERIMSEMSAIAAYGTGRQKPYVHPMIKTIVYFYWIRRIQPFQIANALFARLVIHIFEYQQGYRTLPLTPLTRSAASEWAVPPPGADDARFDATNFVIKRLKLFLNAYLEAERELRDATRRYKALCARFERLGVNHRQARILDEALALPTSAFTIKRHARSRGLAYETARQDFMQLVDAGYLDLQKRGRLFEFRLAQDAERKLKMNITQE